MRPSRRRGPKTTTPSFDLARSAAADTRTGWVYRSDAVLAPLPPAPSIASPAVTGRTTLGVERGSPPPSPRRERGWIESGLYVMALPMAITVGMMLAPAIWMFRTRSRP